MKAIIEKSTDKIIYGPAATSLEKMNDVVTRYGGLPTDAFSDGVTDCGPLAIMQAKEIDAPPIKPWLYFLDFTAWRVESNFVVRDRVYRLLDDDQARASAKNKLAEIRYNAEVAGFDLPDGTHVRTELADQNRIANAHAGLVAEFSESVDFKGYQGWSVMTLAELEPIARAVFRHVSVYCFGAERGVSELIDTKTADEMLELDINDLFSAKYQELAAE
ncbi:hypothetical protein M3I01_013375 [Marinomonas sp. RSW2]|uniref:DUF4376 domain-containing protein n=1 Tax=Marinomonas maritima TaxID=2940935 RepID=A0ABT5WGF8_9GAMM|nr:hypothetical protein [Marinomonas maritima]MDE8603888.1 hypothetical protein [Marinomonas maritima]